METNLAKRFKPESAPEPHQQERFNKDFQFPAPFWSHVHALLWRNPAITPLELRAELDKDAEFKIPDTISSNSWRHHLFSHKRKLAALAAEYAAFVQQHQEDGEEIGRVLEFIKQYDCKKSLGELCDNLAFAIKLAGKLGPEDRLKENMARTKLYSMKELLALDKATGTMTLDEEIYLDFKHHDVAPPLQIQLDRTRHDVTLLAEARELLRGRKVCGFMGGHRRVSRGQPEFAACAHLARYLCRNGQVILQGGGPGAMEAAALGAYLSEHEDDALEEALAMLALAPNFADSKAWLQQAMLVRERFPSKSGNALLSLGVPTWVYGHEPSNLFSSTVCKCFSNALREEILTTAANTAVFFFPGSMGTFQEAFQVCCLVHYDISPHTKLVFVDEEFWTQETHVFPMLDDWAKKQGGKWREREDGGEKLLNLLPLNEQALVHFAQTAILCSNNNNDDT